MMIKIFVVLMAWMTQLMINQPANSSKPNRQSAKLAALKQADEAIRVASLIDLPALGQQAGEILQRAHNANLIVGDEYRWWLRKLEDAVVERRTRPARCA